MTDLKIGFGTDIHVLEEGRDFILGGVKIPYEKGFKAHSDGDVLLHAVTDAIIGALGLGDIGGFFPDTDEKYKNADSAMLLAQIVKIMHEKGFEIVNADSTIHAQRPKLAPFVGSIRQNTAKILNIPPENFNVKAKTGEGVDAVGEKLAVRTNCVVLLRKISAGT